MFIYSFPRPVTLLVEFEEVDDVLPDAVEAAGDGGYRGHVGAAIVILRNLFALERRSVLETPIFFTACSESKEGH